MCVCVCAPLPPPCHESPSTSLEEKIIQGVRPQGDIAMCRVGWRRRRRRPRGAPNISSDVAKGPGDIAGDVKTGFWTSPATSPPQDLNRWAWRCRRRCQNKPLDVASDVASTGSKSPGDVPYDTASNIPRPCGVERLVLLYSGHLKHRQRHR